VKKTIEQIPFITLRDESTAPPLYRQIYEAIRAEILNGIYASGMRLPSTRELAQNLSVSRITVVNAYDQLLAEGYLEGRSGAGTFVAGELPETLLHTGQRSIQKSESTETSAVVRLSQFGNRLESRDLRSIRTNAQTSFIPFQNGMTAISEFPFEVWSRISNRITRQPNQRLLGYGDPQGFEPLREAVAAHLRSSRGVKCSADQVVITSGAQQALDLALADIS
jgi:GntR family transcriptional regulator/MocR family aminotransferase